MGALSNRNAAGQLVPTTADKAKDGLADAWMDAGPPPSDPCKSL